MPWKLASLGTLLAAAMLAGCSTTSTESATTDVATTDTGHSRCEAKAAEFTIGKQASPRTARAGAYPRRGAKCTVPAANRYGDAGVPLRSPEPEHRCQPGSHPRQLRLIASGFCFTHKKPRHMDGVFLVRLEITLGELEQLAYPFGLSQPRRKRSGLLSGF